MTGASKRLFSARSAVVLAIVVFGAGFMLNFVWEALHGVYLYQGHDMPASRYVPMLVYVSAVDGLLILALYGWMALLWGDFFWVKRPGALAVFAISALILAAAIEYRGGTSCNDGNTCRPCLSFWGSAFPLCSNSPSPVLLPWKQPGLSSPV